MGRLWSRMHVLNETRPVDTVRPGLIHVQSREGPNRLCHQIEIDA
jgi:hypothetical protein